MKKLSVITAIIFLAVIGCKKDNKSNPKPLPVASFSFSVPGNAPASVTFTNTSQNSDSYIWDFGDGEASSEQNPIHIFKSAGSFTVKLTAVNAQGTNSFINNVSVNNKPIANFNYSTPGYAPTNITFTNLSQFATSYLWEFGDNLISTDKDPTHFYNLAATYTVKLTATGIGGSSSYTKSVTIINKPIVYNNCKITKVTINGLPATDAGGAGWDGTSGPDIFVKILAGATELLNTTSSRYTDNTTYPKSWNLITPIAITNLSISHTIQVYDYDWPDADDLMGTLIFLPSNYPSYPATATLISGSSNITLDLQWY